MSKVQPVKTTPVTEEEKPHLALVEAVDKETPAPSDETAPAEVTDEAIDATPIDLTVYLDSLGVSMLDKFSLVRLFRDQWHSRISYYQSEEGVSLSLDEAIEAATHKVDDQRAAEILERLLTCPAENIHFSDLHKLWIHSAEDAEFIWQHMKHEARREFMAGHLAATVFEPVDWMRSAWKRAKLLGVRDSFIDEYQPEGGVEIALVDTMAQAYFLQLHWTEEAVKRTQAEPYRHSHEYDQWEMYKRESAKAHHSSMWDRGYWEIPYASELECQEQAVKMAEHFSRLFQHTMRMLDNHRLAKAKLKRLSVPAMRRSIVEDEHEHSKEWKARLEQARKVKG
jgi:hypothetical protein